MSFAFPPPKLNTSRGVLTDTRIHSLPLSLPFTLKCFSCNISAQGVEDHHCRKLVLHAVTKSSFSLMAGGTEPALEKHNVLFDNLRMDSAVPPRSAHMSLKRCAVPSLETLNSCDFPFVSLVAPHPHLDQHSRIAFDLSVKSCFSSESCNEKDACPRQPPNNAGGRFRPLLRCATTSPPRQYARTSLAAQHLLQFVCTALSDTLQIQEDASGCIVLDNLFCGAHALHLLCLHAAPCDVAPCDSLAHNNGQNIVSKRTPHQVRHEATRDDFRGCVAQLVQRNNGVDGGPWCRLRGGNNGCGGSWSRRCLCRKGLRGWARGGRRLVAYTGHRRHARWGGSTGGPFRLLPRCRLHNNVAGLMNWGPLFDDLWFRWWGDSLRGHWRH
eukprot:PhM_4_TR3011/c3_g1_i1/m.89511